MSASVYLTRTPDRYEVAVELEPADLELLVGLVERWRVELEAGLREQEVTADIPAEVLADVKRALERVAELRGRLGLIYDG